MSHAPRVHEIITRVHADESLIVRFNKRSTGEERRMECIYRSKRNPDSRLSYNPSDKSLVMVFDKEKGDPRMVSCTTTKSIIATRTGEVYEGRDLTEAAMGQGLEDQRESVEEMNARMQAIFG